MRDGQQQVIDDITQQARQVMAEYVGSPSPERMAREVAEQVARRHCTTFREFTWRMEGNTLHIDAALNYPPDTPITVTIAKDGQP